ncbi:MAG: VWA domain-containing protein [Cyclobacteriaceae bacterium]|nr:VWA domain-containing protein [Cyclobacteriaceae bacterium]
MKRFLTFIFFIGAVFPAFPQGSNVFVLVDVSKSVNQSDLNQAKTTLTDVLLGNSLSNAFVNFGSPAELLTCKLEPGDKIAILKFGNKQTLTDNNFNLAQIRDMPEDVLQQVNQGYPRNLTDDRTYLMLAKAKVAEYAKSNNISGYRLYLITDNISDDYGPNGRPEYTDYERSLAEGYNTTANPVIEASSIKVRLNNARNKDYVLEFIPEVDISGYNLPNPSSPVIITDVEESSIIRLTSLANGRRNNEVETKSETLNINWSCTNYPEGGRFTVIIAQYDGGKFRDVKKDLSSYNASFRVPDGKYKITVSAQNFQADPDTTYVRINAGGGGWFWIFLLLLAAGGAGYYYWNRRRRIKIEDAGVARDRDIFSPGDTTSQDPSKTEYF